MKVRSHLTFEITESGFLECGDLMTWEEVEVNAENVVQRSKTLHALVL